MNEPLINSEVLALASEAKNSHAHRAVVLNTGDDALLLRAHLLRSAKHSARIQTFMWKNDECGRYFVTLVLETAKRGVKIQILVDSWPANDFPPLLVFLGSAHPNIEVKFYNPPSQQIAPSILALIKKALTHPEGLNHRMHNKAFIVDDELLILGGRNYENTYYDRSPQRNFKDREIAIVGPVVDQACASFNEYWSDELAFFGQQLEDYETERKKISLTADSPRAAFELGTLFDETDPQSVDAALISARFAAQFVTLQHAELVADKPGVQQAGESESLKALERLLQAAKHDVLLQTPYFVLDQLFRDHFSRLLEQNPPVDIRVSTNSLASTDNVISYATAIRDRALYLHDLPLQIFELCPRPTDWRAFIGYTKLGDLEHAKAEHAQGFFTAPPHKGFHLCLHAKTYIIDSEVTLISSANIDPRSSYINSEAGIVIRDAAFAAMIKENIERDLLPANSWPVGFVSRQFETEFSKNAAQQEASAETACFALKPGHAAVSCYDRTFHENYENVGRFPDVEGSAREIEARLISVFSGALKPFV